MEPDEGTQPDDQQADAPRWDKTQAASAPGRERAQGGDAPDEADDGAPSADS
jgi:hypothetical protein